MVSSSSNCRDVLAAAGILDLFEERIDGVVAEREHLRGKPAPDTFLAAARLLGVEPAEAAVFEDALAGVAAGRAGHFGYVVGVDRVGQADALPAHGADRVVAGPGGPARRRRAPRDRPTPAFRCEPWSLTEEGLHLDVLAQTESVFALSNGHIGWRGNLDEGEPHGLPGTYLGAFYELRPLPSAEPRLRRARVQPDVVNVTNGKLIRLLVDDEPFDVRYGELRHHRADPGPPGRHARADGRVGVAGTPDRADTVHPAGVVHPAGHRRHLLRGGGGRP